MRDIIRLSLENRSLNHLLFLFLLVLAYFSYTNIAKEMFPPNSLDKVIIQGNYTGSNSTILDQLIVQDIEKIMQNNQNLENIHTLITNGSFHINADIKNNQSKQKIINNLKNEIETLKRDLPQDMDLPTVDSVESFFPLINLSISSDINKDYISVAKELLNDIKKINNLYDVTLNGDFDSLLVIKLNKEILKAYDISQEKTISALRTLYSLYPIGKINTSEQSYYVGTKNSLIEIETILNTQIKINNTLLYVKDIATIKYDYENQEVLNKTNGKPSVNLAIKKAKKGDSIALSKEIRALIKTYKIEYKDIDFEILSDSSFWIQTRLNVISSNIIIGLILLFFAIWIFISLKIALVVILGIPVSFAFGLIGMDFLGSSLNTLSMIGVLLSLGILVDEAIVVSENIHRHRLLGKSVKDACIDGTNEVIPILFASLLTTIIAFLPLTMLSGGLGLFIKIIPIIVILLVISSFIESFIFLPLHYKALSKVFKDDKKEDFRDRFWNKTVGIYKTTLYFLMKRRYLSALFIVLFTFVGSYVLIKQTRFQLFPEFDAMTINITGKVKNNTLSSTLEQTKELETLLLNNLNKNDVASLSMTIGMNSDGRSKHNKGESLFTITLNLHQKIADDFFNKTINPIFTPYKNKQERTRTLYAKQIQEQIEKLLIEYNTTKDFLEFNISIPQTGVVKNDIVISIASKDNLKIKNALTLLRTEMNKIKEVYGILDDMSFDDFVIELELNNYGKSLGFSQTMLVSQIKHSIEQNKVSKVIDKNNNLVELKVDFSNKERLQDFENITLSVPNSDEFINLKSVANMNIRQEVTTIRKDDLQKVFTLTASLKKRKLSSRDFYSKINSVLEKMKKNGVDVIIKGEEKTNQQIKKDIFTSFLFALFGILIVLTWLFKSLRISFFALSVIPLSIFGVLLGHFILGSNITFSSLLGFIGLIGIVMNDTLIVLKFIKDTKNKEELVSKAAIRVRPVLLTSITTILGLTMLIFFASGESLLMQPLAISIGFGLLYATIINLYYVPLAYSFLRRYKSD